MEFVTIRDLRLKPADVWRRLRQQHDLVLTSNGRPVALLVDLAEEDVEEVLMAVRRARAQSAVSRMRARAAERGLSHLNMEEVEAEIAQIREGRKG